LPIPILKMLLVAPLPPPEHGGIINWSRMVRAQFAAAADVRLDFVDTMPRFRKIYDRNLFRRLVGGASQALRNTVGVSRQLKRDRPDVLHLCTSGGPAALKDRLILRLSRRFHAPSVLHYHAGRLPKIAAKRSLEWSLTLRAMQRADAVVVLDVRSEAVVKEALPGQRVLTLPNMVDLELVDDVRRQHDARPVEAAADARLVFVGHVLPEKGLRELVQAIARLPEPGVSLDVVGPVAPEFRDELTDLGRRCGAAKRVRLHGGVDHRTAIRHILAADALVLPSYTEGAPLVVLEAMACGKPVVSCSVGSVPETLDIGGPQECGACVPSRDVDALTAALEKVVHSPQLRQAWGAIARCRAEQLYAAPVACARLKELWRSLVLRDGAADSKVGTEKT